MWSGEGEVKKVAPICARTRVAVETISFVHVVDRFSRLTPNEPNFVVIRSHSKNELFGVSVPNFFSNFSTTGEIVVCVIAFDSRHILCRRRISLLDVSGKEIFLAEDDNRFDDERRDIRRLSLPLTRQDILNKKSEYLSDDKLLLRCEYSFSTGLEYHKIEETDSERPPENSGIINNQMPQKYANNSMTKPSPLPSALDDMKELYMSQCVSDVELKTQTKSFPSHKSVLCARSPVFRRMLTVDMRERNTDRIEVDDVVHRLLLFLYSDSVQDLEWTVASRLYYAADKYQIEKLKSICSSFLLEHLSPTHAGELLLLADTHGDQDLKRRVEDFILEHEQEVFGSEEWEKLMETHPLLAMKTMHLKYKRR